MNWKLGEIICKTTDLAEKFGSLTKLLKRPEWASQNISWEKLTRTPKIVYGLFNAQLAQLLPGSRLSRATLDEMNRWSDTMRDEDLEHYLKLSKTQSLDSTYVRGEQEMVIYML